MTHVQLLSFFITLTLKVMHCVTKMFVICLTKRITDLIILHYTYDLLYSEIYLRCIKFHIKMNKLSTKLFGILGFNIAIPMSISMSLV